MRRQRLSIYLALATLAALFYQQAGGGAWAARISDIRNTVHNFSSTSGNTVRAQTEDEVCVFCHTPHAATQTQTTPLWNRKLSTATYTPYSSASLDATGLDQPGGSSKLCLSCHDGTIAIGQVNVLNGAFASGNIAMVGNRADGTIRGSTSDPATGENTGYTRRLGVDLRNDHPISFTYNDALAVTDTDLRKPSLSNGLIANRVPGVRPKVPLENGQVQCTTCHDPHIRDTVETNIKFLRLNRFQKTDPSGTGTFDETNDILCLACHPKDGWVGSAHALSTVANEQYTDAAATQRQFPLGTTVAKAACLNCHDPHTVQGAKRLLREGTNSAANPKSGGSPAQEEVCYACHSATGNLSAVTTLKNQGTSGFGVPDIKTDFTATRRMPIATQPETHEITGGAGGKDLIETASNLGTNRHVECSDCHNPHRVIRNRLFNATPSSPDASGAHNHAPSGAAHTNIASGVLRGSWGVEPVYGSSTFGPTGNPTSFTVKRGNPPAGTTTAVAEPYVTREYQICLKCHSNYAYGANPPALGATSNTTPSGTNNLTTYTNQAMEFQAPLADQGEPSGTHRSWHPVMNATGRNTTVRKAGAGNWLAPWNNSTYIGSQTMYCSDCHGSNTAAGTVVPTANSSNQTVWGPHGSANNFILKGLYNNTIGSANTGLCFKCHSYTLYATRGGGSSGFGGSKDANLHSYHADKLGKMRCNWCHVAVPHGWKNKALLVNLNQVGSETGAANVQVRNNTTAAYNLAPYYLNAVLKIRSFPTSGNWSDTNCGSSGAPGNGQSGRNWMRDSNENCTSAP
jgi:hypothetical protein